MTLFFVSENLARILDKKSRTAKKVDDQTWHLAQIADVIVHVEDDGSWLKTSDRHNVAGDVVHPADRARLLQQYTVIVRMTDR